MMIPVTQVQNLIESCLHMYMDRKEVVDALSHHSKIEPRITELGNAHCSPLVQ
jgi:uncharacterized protein (TIGR01589 family)